MPPVPPTPVPSSSLPRAIRVGLVLCALGVMAILVDVLPFFAGADNRPLWLNLASDLLLPLGLLVLVGSVLRRGRREQKAALREVERVRRT